MFRPLFFAFVVTACFFSAAGQGFNTAVPEPKSVFPKEGQLQSLSLNKVYVSPSPRETEPAELRAPTSWIIKGYELRALIGMLYNFDSARIVFADPELAKKRYDIALVLTHCEQQEVLQERVRTALTQELKIAVSQYSTARDVYVVTAPQEQRIGLRQASGSRGFFSTTSSEMEEPDSRKTSSQESLERLLSLDSISMASGTVDDFCSLLEQGLDRPVLNETGLQGKYDVELQRGTLTREEFFTQIWTKLGLRIARERRNVAMLTVRLE